jgi:hypothetical protein
MRVTDHRPVLQHEGRHDAARIDSTVGLGVLLTFAEIDRYQRHRNSVFRQENAKRREFGDVAE